MPRKPKKEKHIFFVEVNGTLVRVILHPPEKHRKCWYAYWPGLKTKVGTGEVDLEKAIIAARKMVENGGKRSPILEDATLTDEEFEKIQKAHFAKIQDPAAQERARKTEKDCLEAIAAFKAISGLKAISQATPDDCAAFQRKALTYPKNWRQKHPNSEEVVKPISPNTVLKWSRELRAAFGRADRNSTKCVRGVVDPDKLLRGNPWQQFTWAVEEKKRPIRHFDSDELVSFLNYLETEWPDVKVAALLAKVYLWSWGRREEIASLTWPQLRVIDGEYHFESIGKRGVKKWFRIPETLYQDLVKFQSADPFVFAAYNNQLRRFYERSQKPASLEKIGVEFRPENLSQWLFRRIIEWSKSSPNGPATIHVFRKTSMQHARRGEDINSRLARDIRVTQWVMETHYLSEGDEELRQKSNRTFDRIRASLVSQGKEVAERFGYTEPSQAPLHEKIQAAMKVGNWALVSQLSAELAMSQ